MAAPKRRLERYWIERFRSYMNWNLKAKTITEYNRLYAKLIHPAFGHRLLTTVRTPAIRRWHQAQAQTAPHQANRALAVLSAVYRLAVEDGVAETNPCHGVRLAKEKARKVYLRPEQIKAFLKAVADEPPAEAAFLLCMLYTGARPGELAQARWEWLNGDVLELPDSKTGERSIYLPQPALAALSPLQTQPPAEGGPMFPGMTKNRWTTLWRRIRRNADGALDGVRLYDLRHTFASVGLEAGLSLEAIGQLLGHSKAQTTKRYAHLMQGTGRRAAADTAAAMGRLVEGES